MNVSTPLKPGAGTYSNDPSAFSVSVPCAGGVPRTAVSDSPSGSRSLTSTPGAATVSGTPGAVVYESGCATNPGFDVRPVIVTIATADFFTPSDALYVKLSEPSQVETEFPGHDCSRCALVLTAFRGCIRLGRRGHSRDRRQSIAACVIEALELSGASA